MTGLVIRADAGTRIGTGHVMRCLGIAQAAISSGVSTTFVMHEPAPGLVALIEAQGAAIVTIDGDPAGGEDARQMLSLGKRSTVLLDGYHFDAAYQRLIAEEATKLAVIDDYGHAGEYVADLIINPNLHFARKSLYARRGPKTRLLLGTHYLPLRREFVDDRPARKVARENVHRVLVTMGGADPAGGTWRVVEILDDLLDPGAECIVVVGANNPRLEDLRRRCEGSARVVRLEFNANNMAKLMASADLAVGASGFTSYEMAFMGLPAVLVSAGEGQAVLARELERRGCAIYAGDVKQHGDSSSISDACRSLLLPDPRRRMTGKAKRLFDGRGAQRIVDALMPPRVR